MPQTKKNTKKDLKKTTESELQKKLNLFRENVRVIKFKAEGSRSKNVKELATLRKDIARILTEMNNSSNK